MIQIASQPISRSYIAHPLSRSFVNTYLCYVFVLIIPAIILVNINYSWPQYKRVLIQPTLSYQAYQITCLSEDGTVLYNSNFQSTIGAKDYSTNLNVGIHQAKIRISAQIVTPRIKTCSAQIYFKTKLGSSISIVSHLPLNIAVSNNNFFLKTTNIKGTVILKSSKLISQSSIISLNQSQYGTYPYSFSGNFRYSGSKSLSLESKTLFEKSSYQNIDGESTFIAEFKIISQSYFQQSSLIQKLRVFIPNFMYLCLFLWWVIVNPLIDWMLQNKVYTARLIQQKVKRQ